MLKPVRRILLLLAAMVVTAPALAKTDVDIILNFAPPVARYESSPGWRSGHVWNPGYWDWRSNRHVWISGNWMRERPGYTWHAAAWIPVGHGWRFVPGYWESIPVYHRPRDSDRDGVPDYRDRTPYGQVYSHGYRDTRHGRGYDRSYDRDRDGIPDYRDRYPRDRDNDGRSDRWDRRPYDPRR
jgi:WXXGXW repeat (2 copies)